MAALTQDRDTPRLEGDVYEYPMKGTTTIYLGGLTAINSSGLAVPASDTAGLKIVGRAEETAVNSGADSTRTIRVRKGVFGWDKDGTNTPAAAHVGGNVYVVDDHTVATDTTNDIVAGKLVAVDANTAWVETR